MWLSHQAFKWARRTQGRDVLIQMPNLPRALNIWLKPTSVASCEPRRTVTVVFGVSQCTKAAAPTRSKMRISNIPAVVSFRKLPDPSVKPNHRCPARFRNCNVTRRWIIRVPNSVNRFPGLTRFSSGIRPMCEDSNVAVGRQSRERPGRSAAGVSAVRPLNRRRHGPR